MTAESLNSSGIFFSEYISCPKQVMWPNLMSMGWGILIPPAERGLGERTANIFEHQRPIPSLLTSCLDDESCPENPPLLPSVPHTAYSNTQVRRNKYNLVITPGKNANAFISLKHKKVHRALQALPCKLPDLKSCCSS